MAAHPIVTRTARFAPVVATEASVVAMLLARSGPLTRERAHLIVTPNMNHLAALQRSIDLGQAYASSSMVLADGWPVARLARALGGAVGARTTGSGVVALLARTPGEGRRVFLIGGSADASTAAAVAAFTAAGWIVAAETAPAAWLATDGSVAALTSSIETFAPDIVLIGLGSPKQELLAMRIMAAGATTGVFLGVGSAIDFLAGEKRRAPAWMQRAGVEWLHRMGTEPGRLVSRYLADLLPFALVVLQSWRAARVSNRTEPGAGA